MVEESEKSLKLNLKKEINESYDIIFGFNLFETVANEVKNKRCAIITDSNVLPLFGEKLKSALEDKGIFVNLFSFEAGEESKSIYTCVEIMDQMFEKGYGRDTIVLALGGGVVGDMAGFIASLFNRGVDYIQIPTSLLAQVDSSIGGKTGVDSKHGKNLIGTFKQPLKVFIDIDLLENIPDCELKCGLAEIIKHGIIYDKELFNYIEENLSRILAKDKESLLHIVKHNCRIKASVVERDKLELGERRILNYGHTIGHAVEILSDFKMNHGESISIGMMVAACIAQKLNLFSEDNVLRQEKLLKAAGLPIKIPEEMTSEKLIEVSNLDKKAIKGKARYCLPCEIGKMCNFDGDYVTFVEDNIVKDAIEESR